MHIFNLKLKTRVFPFFLQPFLGMIYIFCVLLGFGGLSNFTILGAIGVTSLASSTFITFTQCRAVTLRPRHLIGGYVIATVVGALMKLLMLWVFHHEPNFANDLTRIACAAIVVGVTTFVMAIIDMEHPPAAGFAIGLVLEEWTARALIVIGIALVALVIIHLCLGRFMKDLA